MKTSNSIVVMLVLVLNSLVLLLPVEGQGHEGPGVGEILLMGKLGAPVCGVRASGKVCPDGYCCSQWGYCGTTDAYCGEGCQSQCDYNRCGKEFGGKNCRDELCCSEYGWCGNSDGHCGEGCQSQCSYWRCGKDFGGRICTEDMCCSQYGWCGYTDDHCEDGCQSQCYLPSLLPTPLRRMRAIRKLKANHANMLS